MLALLLGVLSHTVLADEAKVSKDSIAQALRYANSLKGIEFYYVALDLSSLRTVVQNAALLMEYNGVPIPNEMRQDLKDGASSYVVTTLDRRNGYMELTCRGGCEGTWTYTYWRNRGGDIVAAVETSCGPFCESSISFYRQTPRGMVAVDTTKMIGEIDVKQFWDDSATEPHELLYKLPRKGTSIIVESEGKCVELKWLKGTFGRSKIQPCNKIRK